MIGSLFGRCWVCFDLKYFVCTPRGVQTKKEACEGREVGLLLLCSLNLDLGSGLRLG